MKTKYLVFLLAALPLFAEPVTKTKRNVSKKTKDDIYAEAGISKEAQKGMRIDHIVPLEIGGSNDKSNLQIQAKERAAAKDVLENKLTRDVKAGRITKAQAEEQLRNFK